MRFPLKIHPRAWHFGAWLLAAALVALALLMSHRSTGGVRRAGAAEPDSAAVTAGSGFVAEILDSTYRVGPAEFLALDLPRDPPGSRAVHILGTIATKGRGKDIMVRLFRAGDYARWLRRRGLEKGEPFWTSPRARTIQLDQDLPPGESIVLLLDNGYSLRTPKDVSCQLQLQYVRAGIADAGETAPVDGGGPTSGTASADSLGDNLPPPRSNEEEAVPPPPPPPPEGY